MNEKNEEIIKYIEDLLDVSNSNLDSSLILFDKKKYPESLFLLQQSIEKSTKAMGLFFGGIKKKHLEKKVGHDLLKIYEYSLKKLICKNNKFLKIMSKNPQLRKVDLLKTVDRNKLNIELESLLNQLNIIRKEKDRIGTTSRDLDRYLSKIIKFFKEKEKALQELQNLTITDRQFQQARKKMISSLLQLKNISKKIYSEEYEKTISSIEKLDKQFVINKVKETFSYIIPPFTIYIISLYLSIIIFPHSVSKTRYPDFKNPNKFYTLSKPILKKFSRIAKLQKKCIKEIYLIIQNYKKMMLKEKKKK